MIVVSIASINEPARRDSLSHLLSSLLSQDTPPDKITVFLEGYPAVPNMLKNKFTTVKFIISTVTGGLSSYRVFSENKNSICISLDDDLIIPDDFISKSVSFLNSSGKTSAITYLSKFYTLVAPSTFYDDYVPLHFCESCSSPRSCHILGSGISLFHSAYMEDFFVFAIRERIPGIYRDMLVSYYLWLKGITILRAPSPTNWITGRNIQPNCNDMKPLTSRQNYFFILRRKGFLNKNFFGGLK